MRSRQPRLLALLDAGPHCERRHGLAIAELAIDHGERRRIDDNLGGLVGNDVARLLPADIDRNPDHAVAVMAGEIGCREIGRDPPGFLGRGFRVRKNLGDEIDQIVDFYGDHVRISACPCNGGADRISGEPQNSRAGFHDRLGRHFERKFARVSTIRQMIAIICPAVMRRAGSIMQICAYSSASASPSPATSISARPRSSSASMSCSSASLRAP